MKVKGVERISKSVEIDIDICDVIDQLNHALKRKYGVDTDWYINNKGQWEDWYDTGHGSGLTTKHRDATVEEVEIFAALKIVRIAARSNIS